MNIRIEGILAKWNDERGFGFISPARGGPEVFVHISAFPKDGRRPAIGERLTFEIETDGAGKKRAKNLLCPGRPALRSERLAAHRSLKVTRNSQRKKHSLFGRILALAIILVIGSYAYREHSRPVTSQPAITIWERDQEVSTSFKCDGRTHCSQMTSCAEAKYFLQNCPNVKMDGDHNGVPCEQQWCKSAFFK